MKRAAAAPKLRVVGCGEAFDTGLGNNSCVLYDGVRGAVARKPQVPTILFDCGYQVPERLWALPKLYPRMDGVYLTHLHADHAFGLVPLLTRYWEEKRKAPFRVVGPRGVKAYLTRLLDLGYPGIRAKLPFELEWVELQHGDDWSWGHLRLRCARSAHSVMNLAVRADGPDGLSFGVSGDGQLTDATRELFRGVDVLFHEVYSRAGEIPTHCDLKTLSDFAKQSGIRRIGITHISRYEKARVEALLRQLKKHEPGRWFRLEPGMEVTLKGRRGGSR